MVKRSERAWRGLLLTACVAAAVSCGAPAPAAERSEVAAQRVEAEAGGDAAPVDGAELEAAPDGGEAEAAPAGPDLRRPPWARKNDTRLAAIAEEVTLSDAEREAITALWSEERVEILRLLQTHRESGSPDWKVVQDDVAALRASNDETVRELLGDERFAAYDKHRPTVGPAPSGSLKTP